MNRNTVFSFTAVAALSSIVGTASAQVTPFQATWASPFGTSAATATFDLDLTNFNANLNPGAGNDTLVNLGITNLTITVTGTAGGLNDGTWTGADFASGSLIVAVALNPLIEWVGQPQDFGSVWGVGYWGGNFTGNHDFNIFGANPGTPTGSFFYELSSTDSNDIAFDPMFLTSFHPTPTPGAAALLGLGGLVGFRRRR